MILSSFKESNTSYYYLFCENSNINDNILVVADLHKLNKYFIS